MAESIVTGIGTSVDDLIARAARDMFGSGGGVDSIRWAGMSDDQLAAAVRQLNSGPGASGIQQAADALATISDNLTQLDSTLSQQLRAIGVNWQSEAAELAQEMTTAASSYAASAGAISGTNAAAVTAQGDAFTTARNAVPHPDTLQSPANSFLDVTGGLLTGHETDQAAQAAKYAQARQQAVDAMDSYTSQSQSHLAAHTPLPAPRPVTHSAHGVDTSIGQQGTTVSSFAPPAPVSMPPPGGTGLPGQPATGVPGTPSPGLPTSPGVPTGLPGGITGVPGQPAAPAPTPGPPAQPGRPGVPGGSGGTPRLPGVPGVPGGGGAPATPLGPGPVSGIGTPAGPPVAEGTPAAPAAGALSGSIIEDAAIGTAIVGGAVGAGIGGAAARKDALVRSRQLGEPAGETDGEGDARQQAARALLELEGDEAAEAGASARIGATAEPPPSLLEPAVEPANPDAEHRDRYAESDDLFGDNRMVIPDVLDGTATDDPE